jgi:hypothetical protein
LLINVITYKIKYFLFMYERILHCSGVVAW